MVVLFSLLQEEKNNVIVTFNRKQLTFQNIQQNIHYLPVVGVGVVVVYAATKK